MQKYEKMTQHPINNKNKWLKTYKINNLKLPKTHETSYSILTNKIEYDVSISWILSSRSLVWKPMNKSIINKTSQTP